MAQEMVNKSSGEIAPAKLLRDTQLLRGIESFDDVFKLAAENGTDVQSAEELGDGFVLFEGSKDKLIGAPLMFVTWSFSEGDYEREDGSKGQFVTARILARNSKGEIDKLIINDGSTGIAEQLRGLSGGQPNTRPLHAPRGLRKSEYTYTDPETNKVTPATTYYIDVAPAK